MSFKSLGLKESSIKAVEKMGFESPSEIQEKSIPILLDREIDFVGQAQTGTGKTAAFVLPLLEKLDLTSKDVQSLIVAPTRELANQITEEIQKLSHFEPVRALTVYGGTPVGQQIRDLKRVKPQIVVGTAGRIMDFIQREVLDLSKVKYAILDEADEMLDMGFFQDIKTILATIPSKRIWMFSATMPEDIKFLIKRFFCEPEFVKVAKKQLTSDAVSQQYIIVREENMNEAICRYLDYNDNLYAIVFTRTKIGAKELTDFLNAKGHSADALHGDMNQESRDFTMAKFKDKQCKLLVCTDVAARGIDVNDLTHVINFGLPQDNEAYVHRIGRTGRGGSKGIAISIIEPNEHRRLSEIEKITKASIELIELPTVDEIKVQIAHKEIVKFVNMMDADITEPQLYQVFKDFFEEKFDPEQLIKGFFNSLYANKLERYRFARKIDVKPKRPPRPAPKGMVRLYTNFARNDGFEIPDILRFFTKDRVIQGKQIGKIVFRDNFTFIEIPEQHLEYALGLKGTMYKDKEIVVQKTREDQPRRSKRDYRNNSRNNSRRPSRPRGREFNA